MALDTNNPFYNWSKARCLAMIDEIQERVALNALMVTHAGSGSVTQAAADRDNQNILWLRERVAEIDAAPKPGARMKIWRIA